MTDKRRAVRVVPRRAITVAIDENGVPRAYGVVANISDGGACICTDRVFPIGETLTVQLSFAGQEKLVPLECYVIWCGSDAENTYRYGLQWVHPAGSQLRRLIRDC